MFNPKEEFTPGQDKLRELLRREETFAQAVELALRQHALVHLGEVSGAGAPTFADEVWGDLVPGELTVMPTRRDNTIAWCIWHLTRIEDLVCNLLIVQEDQVFNEDWQRRLGTGFTDTGNAMRDEEILQLSRELDPVELLRYQNAVGLRTREILVKLTFADMKRKPSPECLDRLLAEGGLTAHPDSLWLRDYWGAKTVAGLILMPLTRHYVMHLRESQRLKKVIRDKGLAAG